MNNLLKFSVSRTPSNLARLVHSSRSSAASVTSTRPAKKFSIDSSDPLPMYASILQHNLNHMIKMSRQYEKNLNGISHTQKLIQKELEKDQPKISNIELKELIYLSKTDEDLDILAKAINRYLMDNRDSFSNTEYHNDFSRIFAELLYLLKKTSKALDYLHDPSLNRLFRNHRTCEVIYHLVAEANLYDEFISILKKNLPRYYKKTGFRSSEQSGEISLNQQQNEGDAQPNKQQDPLIVPVSHMDIISRFLLKQNTSQALSVFKDLINRIERSGVEVGSFFKLRCIVLAILQNNGNMAFDLMKNKFCEKDLTMQTNLRVMIYSKLGRRDDCLRTLKNMFIYSNKLFPFTLKMLREDSEKLKDSSDVDFKDQIDFFYKRAFVDGRILEGDDLLELLSGAPMLNTDVFIPVEVNDRDELIDREIDAPPSLDQNSQQTQHQQQQYKFKRANFKSFNRS